MRIYLSDKKVLAYYHQKATPDFWDKHWDKTELLLNIKTCTIDPYFIPMVKKFLPTGSLVLEGGCGIGHLVHALSYNGYQAIGIDFAQQTIETVKQVVPELDLRVGDVRTLPFKDEEFDGYISVGVIEHFGEGYNEIITEMSRVIKKGGFLFISFPYMSFLRKLKAKLRRYQSNTWEELNTQKDTFYQFALDHKRVLTDLKNVGFSLVAKKPFDGIKGFKDEVCFLKPFLQNIYDGKTHQRLRPYLDKLFRPFAAHCILMVLRKN